MYFFFFTEQYFFQKKTVIINKQINKKKLNYRNYNWRKKFENKINR